MAMAVHKSASPLNGGVIALIDLPPGSTVNLDGAPQVIRRDDFLGVTDVPLGFHLVAVRCAAQGTGGAGSSPSGAPSPSIGFVVAFEDSSDGVSGSDTQFILARRYDPRTEEVSSTPPDDLTSSNLLRSIRTGGIEPHRAIPYDQFVGDSVKSGRGASSVVEGSWAEATEYVTVSVLRRRGLRHGEKVVPGPYSDEDENGMQGSSSGSEEAERRRVGQDDKQPGDGITLAYPPIPCIDPSMPPGHLSRNKHGGTRRYLASLSPSTRTAIFIDQNPSDRLLKLVLNGYYNGKWRDLLGDFQLSFALFLHLGCLTSFEYW